MKDIEGFLGGGKGGGAMVKERGITFFISPMPWKDAKKINKFVNLHGKS